MRFHSLARRHSRYVRKSAAVADDEEEFDSDRLEAVETWLDAMEHVLVVGDLRADTAFADLRLFAINYVVRRQLEAIKGTILWARADLGHQAVGLVRPALDEVLWLRWVKDLSTADAQELLRAMIKSDGFRSVLAQHAHLSDSVMEQLGFPLSFVDAVERAHQDVKATLVALGRRYHWAGNTQPNARWLAEQTGHLELYEYLHAATSRALHFSMGEVLRYSWGDATGRITTLHPAFRRDRADFALYQLPNLFGSIVQHGLDLFEDAGISTADDEAG
jgi:hypothetical protein